MKLKVLQEDLNKALKLTSRFTSTRTQLPVLGNLLLEGKKNRLQISSTNLEISSTMSIGAKVISDGEVTVPSRAITDIVSNLPSGQIDLESSKDRLKIKTKNYNSTIAGMDVKDFPVVPKNVGRGSFSLPSDLIREALSQTLFAVSVDETRPMLTGVLFLVKKGVVYFVATDGFRLSQKKVSIKSISGGSKLIVPRNVLSELSKISENADDISYLYKEKDSQVVFGVGDTVLSSRVLEGEFPNYESIIPKNLKTKIVVDKEELKRSVKLASVFARESANIVKFSLDKNNLSVFAESKVSGQQKTKLDVKVEKGSEKLEIAFNFRFLEDYINSVKGEEIVIELSGSKSPGVFTDPVSKDYLHLIMPVKIQE